MEMLIKCVKCIDHELLSCQRVPMHMWWQQNMWSNIRCLESKKLVLQCNPVSSSHIMSNPTIIFFPILPTNFLIISNSIFSGICHFTQVYVAIQRVRYASKRSHANQLWRFIIAAIQRNVHSNVRFVIKHSQQRLVYHFGYFFPKRQIVA